MTAKRLITGILAVLVIAAVMAPSMMAQSLVTGDITGTVTDPSGAVVSGATVSLKSDANGSTRSATTGSNGTYRFSLLSPGSYTVSVTASGFSKAETQTSVNIGQATVADVKMAVGSNSQTVEVTSAAPLVNTDSADLSTSFDQNLIANQPNGGNDITYVAQTAPGINMNTGGGYGNFQTSGLPATSNVFTVNGENDMDPYLNLNNSGATNLTLGRNDIAEATVTTNAYGGQFGQQAGAQVSYVTKSGTNQYHGNAEYWWTGRAMDANDWFNNLNSTPRPFANNNEWADSFGGPIKKDKLFFFVDNEGIRYIVPSTQQVISPSPGFSAATLANLAGTPSYNTYAKMFSLYQAAPGYGNGIPVAGGGCGDLVSGFTGACFNQYQATPALPGTEWILSGRVDYNLSDKDHLFWRVRMDHGTQATYADPISPAFSAASYQPAYDGQGQWTHVFSPNATNNFVYAGSYYRAIFTQNDVNSSTFDTWVDMSGLGATSLCNLCSVFPQGRNVTQYQFVDDFSLTKGAHALKFGANYRRYDITDYTFSEFTNPLAFIGDVEGFYTGSAAVYEENFPSRLTMPVALWGIGLYAQDEWSVSKNLKITLALRAEHNSNPVCQLNCASQFTGPFYSESTDPNAPYNSQINANLHQIFRSTDSINWAPRFGFAWSPGNKTTVVRGGFGMFYDAFPAFIGDQFMVNLPNVIPLSLFGTQWADTSASGAAATAAASAAGIRSGFASGASLASLSSIPGFSAPAFTNQLGTFHTPLYQEWSLSLQQAIGDKSSLGLSYVGNHGIHEPIENFPNAAASGLAGFPSVPFSGNYSTVGEWYSGGVSNFNGLTANYSQRLTYGFTVQASYTWSHAMDEVSNGGVLAYSTTSLSYQVNPFCLRCNNYGNADYDIRNSFNASYVWQMPYKFSNKYANGAFGGWTLSQNFFARSGLPFTVMDGTNGFTNYNSSGSTPFGPAQVIPGVPYGGQGSCVNGFSQCLNPNAFESTSVFGAFSTQQRNSYRGPGFFDSDFTINKNFKITERVAFGFGTNFYNIFNHPNFHNPNEVFGGANFGMTTSTTAPPTGPYGSFATGLPSGRIIQFQGKLVF